MDYKKFEASLEQLAEKSDPKQDHLFYLLCKFIDGWEDPNIFMQECSLTDLLNIGENFSSLMGLHEKNFQTCETVKNALIACPSIHQRRLL